jgi:hypothetical protein
MGYVAVANAMAILRQQPHRFRIAPTSIRMPTSICTLAWFSGCRQLRPESSDPLCTDESEIRIASRTARLDEHSVCVSLVIFCLPGARR